LSTGRVNKHNCGLNSLIEGVIMAKFAFGLASIFTKVFFPFSQKQDSAWDSYRSARSVIEEESDEASDNVRAFKSPSDRFTRLIS